MLSRAQDQVQKGYRTLDLTILVEWNHDFIFITCDTKNNKQAPVNNWLCIAKSL